MKSRVAKTIGLAGLIGLMSLGKEANAEEKFSFSGSVGGYSPFGEVVAVNGIPYGVELEGDYGNNERGFRCGLGWFTKTGYERMKFSETLSGSKGREILEGERESSEMGRFYAGVRIGRPWAYVGFGAVAIEGKNLFETTDNGFFKREVRDFVDRKNLHGGYLDFCVGGPIKKDVKDGNSINLFFKGTYDRFFDKAGSSGIKFSIGAIFSD